MHSRHLLATLEIEPSARPSVSAAIDPFDDLFRKARLNYVAKLGCDYLSIKALSPSLPNHIVWQKFQLFEYLQAGGYDKVAFMDADVLITPNCPDVFATLHTGVGVVMDYWQPNPGHYELLQRPDLDFNAGFFVCCRDAAQFLDIRTHASLLDNWSRCCGWREKSNGINDQDYMRIKLKDSNIPYTQLSEFWNYQPWYNDYATDNRVIYERRKTSGVSRFDAYMIHYTLLKNVLPHIDYGILYEQKRHKRLMWSDIGALHQTLKMYTEYPAFTSHASAAT